MRKATTKTAPAKRSDTYEFELDGTPWTIVATTAEIEGRPECVGIELFKGAYRNDDGETITWRVPKGDRAPITMGDLRRVPLHEVIADAAKPEDGDAASLMQVLYVFGGDGPGRRPRALQPEHFNLVARIYGQAFREHEPPTRAVADTFGVPHSTAARWVGRARELGLIEATTPGRPSGAADRRPKSK